MNAHILSVFVCLIRFGSGRHGDLYLISNYQNLLGFTKFALLKLYAFSPLLILKKLKATQCSYISLADPGGDAHPASIIFLFTKRIISSFIFDRFARDSF